MFTGFLLPHVHVNYKFAHFDKKTKDTFLMMIKRLSSPSTAAAEAASRLTPLPLVGRPLFAELLGVLLCVLHEPLLVLGVLLGQVSAKRMVGLRLVDQGYQGLTHLETRMKRWA